MTLPDWTLLTRSALKAELYDRESYFREGLADAQDAWAERFSDVLHGSALFMIKPEGLVAGVLPIVEQFLAEHHFLPVSAQFVHYSRWMWRELWRYQLTCATLDRLVVAEHHLAAGPGLLLGLTSLRTTDLPASVRLTSLKGSAMMDHQEPGTLRHRLRQANRMMSLIHVADEPADLLRELGVLCDRPARLEILQRLSAGAAAPDDEDVLAAARRTQLRDLDPSAALGRIAAALTQARGDPAAIEYVIAGLAAMKRGERISWRPFQDRLDRISVSLDPWDLAVVGTSSIAYDEPGTSKLLVSPDPAAWREPWRATGNWLAHDAAQQQRPGPCSS